MSCVAANCWKAKDICSDKEHNKSFVDESHLLKLGLPCGHSSKQNKYMKINTNLATVNPRNLISDAGLEPTIKNIQTKTTVTDNPMDGNGTGIFGIASYNINDKQDLLVKQIPSNQTTRLPWNTTAVRNCRFAMVEGVVIQGDGDKEVGVKKSLCFDYVLFAFYSTFGTSWTLYSDMFGRKPQNTLPATLTFMVFEIWHIYHLRILDMLISLVSSVPKLSTFEFFMGLEEMVLVSLLVSYSNCENSRGKTADDLEKDHPRPS
ncbi:hypothetical protein V6N11_002127 [Hibiscus sabdariffa]|uniref:Uncharacterized protein n=1 Tax=Hibiscus sabdariffa TaxID=183260 RepID=A0ABR2QUW6_9ROSI